VSAAVEPFPAARRQTYAFLADARRSCHVYLWADVDAKRLRQARRDSGGKLSYVSFVVKAAADAVSARPEAGAVLADGLRPRLAVVPGIHAKVLFDRTIDGRRCVVSGAVTDAHERSVIEVQDEIDRYKYADVDDPAGPFAALRRLQRLPLPVVRLVYRAMFRDPVRRARLQGTFAVTSVGQEPVRAIFPMISGALGFGLGRIADAPVVRQGQVVTAPVFTLSLAFDHRVLDGALAAEVLADVKDRLESWELS
jgi:pyruvate/2-oxoglutarate dehydrogenase complex dihydrolipoamide acyltransferase (E2) component